MALTVFEVHLAPGSVNDELISPEVIRETEAKVMTVSEAKKKGFGGLPEDPNIRIIAVQPREAKFIEKRLEGSNIVSGYRIHHVDT